MYHIITLKDLVAISQEVDICNIGSLYKVSALTNQLEGNINALVKFISTESETLGRTALFSIRSGEQVCLSDLTSDEQLIIPDDYFARFKESVSLKLGILGNTQSIWERTIDKINAKHNNDTNKNFEMLPTDLSVPEFKYEINTTKEEEPTISNTVENKKESFFSRLFHKTKKNQDTES